MKLQYLEKENRSVAVSRNGEEIGAISGGEAGIDCRSRKFWDVATGATEAPAPVWSYWLKDLRTAEYVNSAPLSTINQAKALAEYHFNKD